MGSKKNKKIKFNNFLAGLSKRLGLPAKDREPGRRMNKDLVSGNSLRRKPRGQR